MFILQKIWYRNGGYSTLNDYGNSVYLMSYNFLDMRSINTFNFNNSYICDTHEEAEMLQRRISEDDEIMQKDGIWMIVPVNV
jgi:hypothetical protein